MSKLKVAFTLLAAAVMFGNFGCAVGQGIKYHDVGVSLNSQGTSTVAVSTLDSRNYVTDGEKDPSFIGTFRGGFGNPFDVSTESENPLAKDMTMEICSSLGTAGFTATPVILAKGDAKEEAVAKLKGTAADRLLLLTLREWRSDTYQNTSLYYDADLVVMSKNGDVLGQSSTKGEDDLGGSAWNPPANAKEKVPQAYKKNLEALLNDESIMNALK